MYVCTMSCIIIVVVTTCANVLVSAVYMYNTIMHDVVLNDGGIQVLTGSHDCTIRLWDLAAGKTKAVLTNHKKSVRALTMHPTESVHNTLYSILHVGMHICSPTSKKRSCQYKLYSKQWSVQYSYWTGSRVIAQ